MSGDKELFEMMQNRSRSGQLPSKTVHFIPEERADRVLVLDERIQKVKLFAPAAGILLAFVIGLLL